MLSCPILYLLVLTFQTSPATKVPEDNGQRLHQATPVLNLPLPPNIQLGRNFVYTQEARVTVNPDFVHIVRHVDTSGLNSALTAISSIKALHNRYCTEMTSLVEPKPKNYVQLPDGLISQAHTIKSWAKNGYRLPELKTWSDVHRLREAMERSPKRYGTFSGVQFNPNTKKIQFMHGDGDPLALLALCRRKTTFGRVYLFSEDGKPPHGTIWPHLYNIQDEKLNLCPTTDSYEDPSVTKRHVFCKIPDTTNHTRTWSSTAPAAPKTSGRRHHY